MGHILTMLLNVGIQIVLPGNTYYPRPRGRRVQYFVCVCVCLCVLPQNCCLNSIITKSKQVAALKLGNLRQTVALYKTG